MIVLIAILTLLLISLIMLGLRLVRPRFSYFWLISATTTILTWMMVLLARAFLPRGESVVIPLITWEPDFLFPVSPALLLDEISWSFSLALATFALSVMLTDVSRNTRQRSEGYLTRGWIATMTLTAFAMLAILSENLLTLTITWAAIDLVEFLIWIWETRQGLENERFSDNERTVMNFSTRIAGILVIIAAGMSANASGSPLGFSASNPEIGIYLLIAAGIRLGALPPNSPLHHRSIRSGMGAMLRLAPAAASFALLPRVNVAVTPSTLSSLILVFSGLAVAYGGISWFIAESAQLGAPFWIMGTAGLALIAAVLNLPETSLALGLSMLLAGGVIILYHAHHRLLTPQILICGAALLMLPYTPLWSGVRIYNTLPSVVGVLLLIFQSLLIAGYIRHSLNPEPALGEVERWIWLIYPSGLTLLLLTFLAFGWFQLNTAPLMPEGGPSLLESWPALVSGIMVTTLLLLRRRGRLVPTQLAIAIQRFFSIEWFYRLIQRAYNIFRRAFNWLNRLLEGQAGILWALLLLTIILSLITQVELGG